MRLDGRKLGVEMKTKYKPRTLSGAAQKVANLESQIDSLNEILDRWKAERVLLAKLAAKEPMFFNPLHVWQAEKIRDEILRNCG